MGETDGNGRHELLANPASYAFSLHGKLQVSSPGIVGFVGVVSLFLNSLSPLRCARVTADKRRSGEHITELKQYWWIMQVSSCNLSM